MLKLRTKFEVCSFSRFRNTEGVPESKRTPRHPRQHMTPATSPLPNFALFYVSTGPIPHAQAARRILSL